MTCPFALRTPIRLLALIGTGFLVACGKSEESTARPSAPPETRSPPVTTDHASATPPAPRLRALLVGVGDYFDNPLFDDLHGPRADVKLMAELLTDRLAILPEDLKCVTDHDADVAGVLTAIDTHLLRRVEAGDEVLVYFSGHGSRVPDVTHRERGLQDSTLVLADSRSATHDGSFDLSDDAMYSLLQPLTARGAHVTIITDSCHSGGVVRGSARVRGIPSGHEGTSALPKVDAWPRGVEFVDDAARPDREELTNYVHIAACAPEQYAFECAFADGVHGVLTWNLVDILRAGGPPLSWREVVRSCTARMERMADLPPQSVWIEGPDADRATFGRGESKPYRRFELHHVESSSLEGDAGWIHGVVTGATIAVFDSEGRMIGDALVDASSIDRFVAHWSIPAPSLPTEPALAGELWRLPSDLPRLRIRVDSESLRSALAGADWAQLSAVEAGCEYALIASADGCTLATLEGIPIWKHAGTESPPLAEFDAACRRETRFRALFELASGGSQGELRHLALAFAAPTASELSDARGGGRTYSAVTIRSRVDARGGGTAVPDCETELPEFAPHDSTARHLLAVLEVVNENLETTYVHVLSLNEAREVTVLFPDPGVLDRPSTDDAPTKRVRIEVGAMSKDAFPLTRPMRERYLVVCTREPLPDLRTLESRTEPNSVRGEAARYPTGLSAVLGGGPVRGGGSIGRGLAGVGLAALDLWITRR